MKYVSTRSAERKVDAAQAIVAGLSHEGGLYVPESFPQFSKEMIGAMADMTYAQRAKQVMGAYLTDYTDEEMQKIANIYNSLELEKLPRGDMATKQLFVTIIDNKGNGYYFEIEPEGIINWEYYSVNGDELYKAIQYPAVKGLQ